MKVINVVQDFNTGGIQKLLLEYLRFFKDNKDVDYKVVVLAPNQHSIFDEICEKEKLKISYLNCEFSKSNHYYIRLFTRWYRYNYRLLKYLRREKPDIVHSHNTRVLYLIETCIKKTKNKYKWFHTLHSDPYAVNENHIPVAKRVFGTYKVRPVCLNETQFFKAKKRYGINSCFYIFNSFDQSVIKQNTIPRNEFRKKIGISNSSLVIGAVGRIDPVKNYPFLIDVFNVVQKIKNNSFLLICGRGSDASLSKLRMIAEEHGFSNKVIFLGDRADVQNIYNSIDIFVQASISEASSLSTLEAQSFNLTCIVSDAIPKESVCLDNKVVRLSLNDPISTWANEILSPSKFDKKLFDLSDYSISKTCKKMANIYEHTLNIKHTPDFKK